MSWQRGWNEILDEMRPYYKIVLRSRALCGLSPGRACLRGARCQGGREGEMGGKARVILDAGESEQSVGFSRARKDRAGWKVRSA